MTTFKEISVEDIKNYWIINNTLLLRLLKMLNYYKILKKKNLKMII